MEVRSTAGPTLDSAVVGPFPLAAKAKEEAARQVRLAEAARRAGQSSAAKRKATEAKEAAKAQEGANLKASRPRQEP